MIEKEIMMKRYIRETGIRLVLRFSIEIKAGRCGLFLSLKPLNFPLYFPNVNDS